MTSKRNYEKLRKDEQEAAHVFQDFIETFQSPCTAPNKKFVRSGTLYSDQQPDEKVGQVYNPKPFIQPNIKNDIASALDCAKILKPTTLEKSKKQEKPKTNLDLLKDELKLRHTERREKDRLKEGCELGLPALSYFEGGDPNSTNLFITNLKPNVTENSLMLEFGAYGPLASVKIMWPRGDDRFRNSTCGFVAFMSRKDAERALKGNWHRDDMRIGWGKSVEIPPHPIYIPNELLKLYLPPPLSGLPFNAQLPKPESTIPKDEKEFADFLKECHVKVTVPLNKKVLMLVHRMVEFVVREGPMFEAFIMNREINNPDYHFLFDYQSPIHCYYRWKIFSILNGESQKQWSMKPFRMFRGGSVWLPPVTPNYIQGMPEELFKDQPDTEQKLSESQTKRLIGLVRELTMKRSKISEAMCFCMDHKSAINDSVEVILESLLNKGTNHFKKIARIYLLSDILTNCKLKRVKVDIQDEDKVLLDVFMSSKEVYVKLPSDFDKEQFKTRMMRVIHHWDINQIASTSLIRSLEDIFNSTKMDAVDDDNSSVDEPLDGASLLKRSLESDIGPEVITSRDFNMKEKIDLTKYFVPSKWDTVDPEEVEAQAMSTEKLYYMELENKNKAESQKRKKKKKKQH